MKKFVTGKDFNCQGCTNEDDGDSNEDDYSNEETYDDEENP